MKVTIDPEGDITAGVRAVENALAKMREARISVPFADSGLVICEANGSPSSVIRISIEDAIRIALRAIAVREESAR